MTIDSLNNLRNKLIADGKSTDTVDDILVKVAKALIKKFKAKYEEVLMMEKSLFEQMDSRYEKQSDYLILCLTTLSKKEQPVGI